MGCDIHIFLERKNSENRWKDSMVYGNKYGDDNSNALETKRNKPIKQNKRGK